MDANTFQRLQKVRPSSVTDLHIQANDRAEELVHLPEPVTADYLYCVSLIQRIQLRVASIVSGLPKRETKKEEEPPKSYRLPRKDLLLEQTEHDIKPKDKGYHCTGCFSSCGVY